MLNSSVRNGNIAPKSLARVYDKGKALLGSERTRKQEVEGSLSRHFRFDFSDHIVFKYGCGHVIATDQQRMRGAAEGALPDAMAGESPFPNKRPCIVVVELVDVAQQYEVLFAACRHRQRSLQRYDAVFIDSAVSNALMPSSAEGRKLPMGHVCPLACQGFFPGTTGKNINSASRLRWDFRGKGSFFCLFSFHGYRSPAATRTHQDNPSASLWSPSSACSTTLLSPSGGAASGRFFLGSGPRTSMIPSRRGSLAVLGIDKVAHPETPMF